jgi:hypothetical protein
MASTLLRRRSSYYSASERHNFSRPQQLYYSNHSGLHTYRRCTLLLLKICVALACIADPHSLGPGKSYAIPRAFGMAPTRIFLVVYAVGHSNSWDLMPPHALPSTHHLHIITSKCCHTSESWNNLQPCWRSPIWSLIDQSLHLI